MLGQPRQNESPGRRSRFIRDAGSFPKVLFVLSDEVSSTSLFKVDSNLLNGCSGGIPHPQHFNLSREVRKLPQIITLSRMLSVTMCLAGQEVRKTNVLTFISCLYLIVTEQVNLPLWSLCGSEAEINKVTSLYKKLQDYPEFPSPRSRLPRGPLAQGSSGELLAAGIAAQPRTRIRDMDGTPWLGLWFFFSGWLTEYPTGQPQECFACFVPLHRP